MGWTAGSAASMAGSDAVIGRYDVLAPAPVLEYLISGTRVDMDHTCHCLSRLATCNALACVYVGTTASSVVRSSVQSLSDVSLSYNQGANEMNFTREVLVSGGDSRIVSGSLFSVG